MRHFSWQSKQGQQQQGKLNQQQYFVPTFINIYSKKLTATNRKVLS